MEPGLEPRQVGSRMCVPACILHCFPPDQNLTVLGKGLHAQSLASADGGEMGVVRERV